MPPIPCVFYSATPLIRLYLRRFIMDGDCPHDYGDGCRRCCNAMVPFMDVTGEKDERGVFINYNGAADPEDARWPKACEGCGREFLPTHYRQVHIQHLYQHPEGELVAIDKLPVGAMWYQDFGHRPASRFLLARAALNNRPVPPDGILDTDRFPHLFVRTPGGVWDMDTIATNGDGWELTGEPPKITAHPSIQHSTGNQWHGWLKNGVLSEC